MERKIHRKVQIADAPDIDSPLVTEAAKIGLATSTSALPYEETIARCLPGIDLSSITAHCSPDAATSAQAMGAEGFAVGQDLVLGDRASLHTTAHEVAHCLQDSVGYGGGDAEQHADTVADRIVSGHRAHDLFQGSGGPSDDIHRKVSVAGVELVDPATVDGYGGLDATQKQTLAAIHTDRQQHYKFKDAKHLIQWLKTNKAEDPEIEKLEDPSAFSTLGGQLTPGVKGLAVLPGFALTRTTSMGEPYEIPGEALHEKLHEANLENRAAVYEAINTLSTDEKGNKKMKKKPTEVNTVKAGLTITYETSSGEKKQWTTILKPGWNSGYKQYLLDDDGLTDPTDFEGELNTFLKDRGTEASKAVRSGKATDDDRRWITSVGATKSTRKHQEDINNDKALARVQPQAKPLDGFADKHAHSETAFAADPNFDSYINEALAKFADECPGVGKIYDVVLEVDSVPNTVCTNVCRPSLDHARKRVDTLAKQFFTELAKKSKGTTLSGAYVTDGRASAQRMFQETHNKPLVAVTEQIMEDHDEKSTTGGSKNPLITENRGMFFESPPFESLPEGFKSLSPVVNLKTAVETVASQRDRVAAFWTTVQDLLNVAEGDIDATRTVLGGLDRTQMQRLAASLRIDKELQLGYPGQLTDQQLKTVLYLLLEALEALGPRDCKRQKLRKDDRDDGNGGNGGNGPGKFLPLAGVVN